MLAVFLAIFVMYGKLKHVIGNWDGDNEDEIVAVGVILIVMYVAYGREFSRLQKWNGCDK